MSKDTTENLDSFNEDTLEANHNDYELGTDEGEGGAESEVKDSGALSSNDGELGDEGGSDDTEEVTLSKKELDDRIKKASEKARKNQDKRWKDRIKKGGLEIKEEVDTEEKGLASDVSDALLARLESRGVMEEQDQQYVLKYARVEGMSPIKALQEDIVQDKLASMQKKREQQKASQAPGNRTSGGAGKDNLAKAIRRYKRDGSVPEDPTLAVQLLEKLRKGE